MLVAMLVAMLVSTLVLCRSSPLPSLSVVCLMHVLYSTYSTSLFPAGVVTFKDLANGNVVAPQIRISYFFTGLKPGPHSMHVHTYGDISSGDIAYVGGHYEGDGNAVRPGVVSKKVAYLQNGFPIVADKDGNAVSFPLVHGVPSFNP